jgi:hypothetical protein
VIVLALDGHQPGALRITDQPHRFPRSAQPGFDFRTDTDPFHIATEHIRQKIVPFMSAVEADLISE